MIGFLRALWIAPALVACGGVEATPGERPPSVLLVAIDGLRADKLAVPGYARRTTPHLEALAARGLRYTDVATPAPWTAPALAALLSGRYPSAIGWTDLELPLPYATMLLSERLSQAGYATGAVANHRFAAACFNLDQGFGAYREVGLPPEGADDDHVEPPSAPAVTDTALALVDAAGTRPFFVLAHYAGGLPPWNAGDPFGDPDYVGPIETGLSLRDLHRVAPTLGREDRAALSAQHDAAVALVDREVGRLLVGLADRDRAADTFVAVVGTCGVELLEHGELGAAKRLYEELVHVPWLLAGPGLEPEVVEHAASLIDVAPTLLTLLRMDPLARADGAPVLPGLPPPARRLISETDRARNLRAVVEGRWKLIHDRETGISELYDLLEDPTEAVDRSAALPGRVQALEAALEAWEVSCAGE